MKICREFGVLTPEDPYVIWPGEGGPRVLAPTFVLYDYTFRPDEIPVDKAVEWAAEENLLCSDEVLLHPDPYPDRAAWCHARVEYTLRRLAELPAGLPLVLASHWPLHRGPTRMLRYPQFAMWCGTELTADWHTRFPVAAAVYGHLHIPLTLEFDGVRFEEVSLGYPREWQPRNRPVGLRRILGP